jgi:hypothetical protein
VLPWGCVGVEQLEFRHFFSLGQVMLGAHLGLHLASVVAWSSINTKFHHSQRIPFKAVTGEVGGAQSVTWCWIEIPSLTVMDPGFSQLAVLWEREKTRSIAFGPSVFAPKRCTGHHLELLAISPTWMFVLVCSSRLCYVNFVSISINWFRNGWLAHVTSRVGQPRYRTQNLHNF